MNRWLLIVLLALSLFGLTYASAAYLAVDGGIIQVFSPQVTVPVPPTPTPTGASCTHSHGYWKNHPDAWPVARLSIGGITYSQAELLAILGAPPKGNPSYILARQLIAAKLNVAAGADGTAMSDVIAQADWWLANYPPGSSVSEETRKELLALAETLDRFNNGFLGPPKCDDDSGEHVEMPVIPPKPTWEAVLTPVPIPTLLPTATIAPDPIITATVTPTIPATATPLTATVTATALPSTPTPVVTSTITPTLATVTPTPEAIVLQLAAAWQDEAGRPLPARPPAVEGFSLSITSPGRAATCLYIGDEATLSCSYIYYDSEGRGDGLLLVGGAPYTVSAEGIPDGFHAAAGTGDFVAGDGSCSGEPCVHTVTLQAGPPPEETPEPEITLEPSPTDPSTPVITVTATMTATAAPLPLAISLQPAVIWQNAAGKPLPERPPVPEAFVVQVSAEGRTAQCRYTGEEALHCTYFYAGAQGRGDGLLLEISAPYTVEASPAPAGFRAVAGTGDFIAGSSGCSGTPCVHTVVFQALPVAPIVTPLPVSPAPLPLPVQPLLQCVAALPDGRHAAFFDYVYEGREPRTIPAGPDNYLSPEEAVGIVPFVFTRRLEASWPEHVFAAVFRGDHLTWTLDGRSVTASPDSPPCARLFTLSVEWHPGAGAGPVRPVAGAPAITITAESDLGTAVCRGIAHPSQTMRCVYDNDVPEPLPAMAGLWVSADEPYQVGVAGLHNDYRLQGAGVLTADDLVCSKTGAPPCTHRVIIVDMSPQVTTPAATATPTPTATPTLTATATPSRLPVAVPSPLSPTPTATPLPSPTLLPPSPTPTLPPPTATPAPAATPTPATTPTPAEGTT